MTGLKPIKFLSGAPYNGAGNLYHVASSDANVIAPGDPVVVTGTANANGVPTVTRATAGNNRPITGVMVGRTNGDGTVLQDSTVNTTASTEAFILVEDNPMVVYMVQASGAVAATDISRNANLLIPASTQDGVSGVEIGAFAVAATSQVKVLRARRELNNPLGANTVCEVLINNHTLAPNSAGV